MLSTTYHTLATTSVVFIDSTVSDYHTLAAGVIPGTTTIILNSEEDGITQITRFLTAHPHCDTLHIISHGAPGCLYLGNSQVNLKNLDLYQPKLPLAMLGVYK
jgi:hypothetical protein